MARTNKTVRQAVFKRIRARIGRNPTDSELLMLVDLLDAYTELCREQSQRWKAIQEKVPGSMMAGNQAYYSHLVAGFRWAASTLINVVKAHGKDVGANNSRRRSDFGGDSDCERNDDT